MDQKLFIPIVKQCPVMSANLHLVQDGHHCKANLTWEPTVDISRLHVYSYLKLKY
jgi:hypothetical protein